MSASEETDAKLARLRREAEEEMRRRLPGDPDGAPAAKRRKAGEAAGAAAGGRFDYAAPKELASGIAGFLLACPLQRENSARKEAGPLLTRYLQQSSASGTDTDGSPGNAKPQAESEAEPEGQAQTAAKENGTQDGLNEADGTAPGQASQGQVGPALAAVKVACRGVVALKLSMAQHAAGSSGTSSGSGGSSEAAAAGDRGADVAPASLVTQIVTALLADIASGKRRRLQHCQRITPVQTTCLLTAEALQAAGAQLAALVAAQEQPSSGAAPGTTAVAAAGGAAGAPEASSQQRSRLTFGIAVKTRQLDKPPASSAEPAPAAAAEAEPAAAVPDRGGIISALAAGFEQALREQHKLEAAVDLKAPDYVLIVEALPVAGALYAALCVLPSTVCVLKPKLQIQAVGKA